MFCHAAAATAETRFGAAFGFDFDLTPSSSAESRPMLDAAREFVMAEAGPIFEEVDKKRMPPFGSSSLIVHANVSRYTREDGTRMEHVDSIEGLDRFRNWLACGSPVVDHIDVTPQGPSVEPNFPSIWEKVLNQECAVSCHNPDAGGIFTSNQLDLSTEQIAYDSLVGVVAQGSQCASAAQTRVVASQPAESLLMQKLRGTEGVCGDPMPLGENGLEETTLSAIEEWIANGALRN